MVIQSALNPLLRYDLFSITFFPMLYGYYIITLPTYMYYISTHTYNTCIAGETWKINQIICHHIMSARKYLNDGWSHLLFLEVINLVVQKESGANCNPQKSKVGTLSAVVKTILFTDCRLYQHRCTTSTPHPLVLIVPTICIQYHRW